MRTENWRRPPPASTPYGIARRTFSLYSSSMKLLFLHGSPAVGKLTVAKALLRMVSGRLFDNHAAIDLACTVFDFDAPGFWELVHSVTCSAIDAAAEHGLSLVVTTFCYVEPDHLTLYEQLEKTMLRHDGELLPVFLHCTREEAVRRVRNPDRVERCKLTSQEGLIRDLESYKFLPVPRSDCLKLDTGVRSADLTAQEIIHRFGLDAIQS
jgi:hypothetical protein